jgi:predicted nuclease of predicted toxin-antitoxin system
MLRFAADENLNNDIVRGLLRRAPALDIVRIQDAGLSGANDPTVLAWTAREQRILLTHDVTTITRYAYDRIRAIQPMPACLRSIAKSPSGR